MQLLTHLGTGKFGEQNASIDGATRIASDGGAGTPLGPHIGIEMHDGGWKARCEAVEAGKPYPEVDTRKATAFFARLDPADEFLSNFNEMRFDPYHVTQSAKVLRAAKRRGMKGVGHFAFPFPRGNHSVETWQNENDRVMRAFRPLITMVCPEIYIPDALIGETVLPLSFLTQVAALVCESFRVGKGEKEVVPVVSDRTVSGNHEAPAVLVQAVIKFVSELGVKRLIYWSDHYNPTVGKAIAAAVGVVGMVD